MTKPILIVMRLADMERVHPEQITDKCARCGEVVAVYPSGQRIMRETAMLGGVELVCHICRPSAAMMVPVPGALDEAKESKRRQ